ncbi:MAG: response regulator [Gammaproteobacteria bacterium]
MTSLLLVDDHALFRAGLIRVLKDHGGFERIEEAGTGEQAMVALRDFSPDVVLMDLNMPGCGGMEATRRMLQTYPGLKIIVLSATTRQPYPARMLDVGALGYISKSSSPEELLDAITEVKQGRRHIGPDVAREMALGMVAGEGGGELERLSQREMQVLLLVAEGQGIRQISDKLCLSPKTVSTYRYRLYEKLDCCNDVELAHEAIRRGIVDIKRGPRE